MTTHELAKWFDGLRAWLGNDLNRNTAKSLADVSEAILDLPDKPFREFVKDLKSFQNGGVEALVEEINSVRNGHGGAVENVVARIKKLKKPELNALSKGLGLPCKKTVDESRKMLQEYLASPANSTPISNGAHMMPGSICEDVELGYRLYCELRDSLANLTIPDIRARFESIRDFAKPALEGITLRLGYHFKGSKDSIYRQLLVTLERMKMSNLNKEVIDSL